MYMTLSQTQLSNKCNPPKEWSCISQVSVLCCLILAATCHWDKIRKKTRQSCCLCMKTRTIMLVGCFYFLQGHGTEKQCGLSDTSGVTCPLAEAGGRAGYIKPRTNHIFAPQGLGKWLNSRDALPLGKDTSLGYKNPGSVSYTDVEVSLDGRLITPILTHFFSY